MIGSIGEVIETLSPTGTVKVRGELWKAESVAGNINAGEKIRVTAIKNMKIFAEPIHHS